MQSGTISRGNPMSEPSRPRRSWRVIALAVVGMLVATYLGRSILLEGAGRCLNVGESLSEPVDFAYVLGGGADTRPFQAAAIYRAGYSKAILIPGLPPDASGRSETEVIHAVLEIRGVPTDAIRDLPIINPSTRGEVSALTQFLSDQPDASVAIVTSDFHTRRARLLARRQLSQHRGRIQIIAVPTDGYRADNWWQSPQGTNMYLTEYGKLVRDYFW